MISLNAIKLSFAEQAPVYGRREDLASADTLAAQVFLYSHSPPTPASLQERKKRRGPKSKNSLISRRLAERFREQENTKAFSQRRGHLVDPNSASILAPTATHREVFLSINGEVRAYSPERFSDLMGSTGAPIFYTDHLLYRSPERFCPSQNQAKVGPQISEDHAVPVYLMKVDDQVGWGGFALRDIQEGEVIGEYVGIVTELRAGNTYTMISSMLPDGYCIDATHFGNEMRYINHSEDPNCAFQESRCGSGQAHMIFVATKTIKKNQQLLTDYGDKYWQGQKPKTLT